MAANSLHFTFILLLLSLSTAAALPDYIGSNSILIALLDSQYTQLSELIEKALLLQPLEQALADHRLTIFAPNNEALDRDLHLEFKRFLLAPANTNSLQKLLLHHIIPLKLTRRNWPSNSSTRHSTLSDDHLDLSSRGGLNNRYVGGAKVVHFNSVVRPDGIIHAVEKVLVPKSVELEFNNRGNLRSISAVKPEGAPEIDPRINKKYETSPNSAPPAEAPKPSVNEALAAYAPALAPAPAPGPGGSHCHFDGEKQVKDFIQTLLNYGGYNEMADILVNLTNLATEMGKLIGEGYFLTVLVPNDEAMVKLTMEKLSETGAPEQMVYYHIVPEYQTEESMYNAVRRFGTVSYDTLRLPHKIVAKEADGSVKFGEGEEAGYLLDPDIYTDGMISVQGIDGVLIPPSVGKKRSKIAYQNAKIVAMAKRVKLLEVACQMLGAIGQKFKFTGCKGN